MTHEERIAINERIDAMIGSPEQLNESIKDLDLTERINIRTRYSKLRDRLFKIAEKSGEKALALTLIQEGRYRSGVTVNGKKFVWTPNHGFTMRSRSCGDLWIEGVGTVFTSGTVAKVFEYILNN